jgi:hypothetical protein
MTKDSNKKNTSVGETDFIEFVPAGEVVSSGEFVQTKPVDSAFDGTLAASTKLDDMPPAFRELAMPKLPELAKGNRARLLMQSPNRLFFYWSIGSNPFQKLNKALGADTASYTLVLKLIDLKRESEQIYPVDAEGSSWFDVEANGKYRAEVGFYAPNRPYVRALFSNTVETPRKSPSTRIDSESDWAISANRFAQVLEVAGFTEDAFDVALVGDEPESAESATHLAFADLVGDIDGALDGLASDEIRYAMLLLASGLTLEELRWKISPRLFAILQERADLFDAEKALTVLKERFEIEADESMHEEFGPAVFGASAINFPKRLKTRRALPKLSPISSPARW